MAETHHKPETVTPTTRCYTVGYASDAKYQPVPAVTLKGHWLKEMGFETGTALEVKVLPGWLILAAQEPQPVSAALTLSGSAPSPYQRLPGSIGPGLII